MGPGSERNDGARGTAHPGRGGGRRSAFAGADLERILIRSGAKVDVVPVGRIDYVQARDDYVGFMVGGRELLKQQTLADLEGQLDAGRFVRIHRSCILNLDRLARLELATRQSYVAILKDGTELPVSRRGYARLSALL